MTVKLGVIADDFTGATDIAVYGAKRLEGCSAIE